MGIHISRNLKKSWLGIQINDFGLLFRTDSYTSKELKNIAFKPGANQPLHQVS